MYYPDELVEEVRMKNDIVDVVSGYVKIQKKGSSYFGLCPFRYRPASRCITALAAGQGEMCSAS